MTGITQEELIEFLKDNLKIRYESNSGSYGTGAYKVIKLELCGEEISETYLDD